MENSWRILNPLTGDGTGLRQIGGLSVLSRCVEFTQLWGHLEKPRNVNCKFLEI